MAITQEYEVINLLKSVAAIERLNAKHRAVFKASHDALSSCVPANQDIQ